MINSHINLIDVPSLLGESGENGKDAFFEALDEPDHTLVPHFLLADLQDLLDVVLDVLADLPLAVPLAAPHLVLERLEEQLLLPQLLDLSLVGLHLPCFIALHLFYLGLQLLNCGSRNL